MESSLDAFKKQLIRLLTDLDNSSWRTAEIIFQFPPTHNKGFKTLPLFKDSDGNVKKALAHAKWAQFIDDNAEYYTQLENTSDGKDTLANIERVPAAFRHAILIGHNKCKAYAEFNSNKKRYEVIVAFNPDLGVIGTTFQKTITKAHLRLLLDMANYLDAYLLNNGNEIIDEKFIESAV